MEIRKCAPRAVIAAAFAALALMWANSLRAEDAYYHIPLEKLNITEGALPKADNSRRVRPVDFGLVGIMQPYAAIVGDGEVYTGGSTMMPWMGMEPRGLYGDAFLAVRAPAGKKIEGLLFVPNPDWSGMVRLPFKIEPAAATSAAKREFLETKEAHYRDLRARNIAGTAWFRHQEDEAIAARTGKKVSAAADSERINPRRRGDVEDTYSLFSGGRAVSENLQLDRAMPAARGGTGAVDIATLTGITVAPMDWKSLLKDAKPETDPLAAAIPADQHALFFPSFQAMMTVMDEADTNGTPLLRMIEPRAEDMDTRHRYQKQLCLGLSDLSRRIGPQVVDAIAMTGSDPYLRMGSDVAVLFQTKKADLLKSLIIAQQSLVASAAKQAAKAVHGDIEGVAYTGVVLSDRTVSSYVAAAGEVVFVSNSLEQLRGLIAASKGSRPALSSQDEYLFFRSRYRRGDADESAFLVLSDATIRRWCGPRWRIADSRRTKVAAALAELQAACLDGLVIGTLNLGPIHTDFQIPDAGELTVTADGVRSSVYGTLDFMTPIIELPVTQVTGTEADAYAAWREGYQRNWSQKFDPIAARFSARPGRIGLELTVMPLIARTDYRELTSLSSGAQIAPGAGDPHAGTLAHFVTAIDKNSAPMAQAGIMAGSMSPALKTNPFGWLGSSIALYADADPFWDQFLNAKDPEIFLEQNYWRLPLALRVEVANPLGAAAFLTALRAYANQTAPDMTIWETRDYKGRNYVRVTSPSMASGTDGTNMPAIFYSTGPQALVVTLNEDLLKRAMDREAAAAQAKSAGSAPPPSPSPWLGTNVCLQLDRSFFKVFERLMGGNYRGSQPHMAWDNLPILNEWKHRFPGQDPVKLHERFWQTRLVCPGGGEYVWNEKWQTMESTVYGHPGEPKPGPQGFGPLTRLTGANLGLNFENQGISARAVFERESK